MTRAKSKLSTEIKRDSPATMARVGPAVAGEAANAWGPAMEDHKFEVLRAECARSGRSGSVVRK